MKSKQKALGSQRIAIGCHFGGCQSDKVSSDCLFGPGIFDLVICARPWKLVPEKFLFTDQNIEKRFPLRKSLDKVASRRVCLEHPREVGFAQNVAEEVFRIAGDPAVALGD